VSRPTLWRPTLKTNSLVSGVVAFSPDGQLLATAGEILNTEANAVGRAAGVVKVWRVSTGELVATSTSNERIVSDLAFSPDGVTLAMASHDNVSTWRVELWNVRSGQTGLTLSDQGPYPNVAFSPDGAILAVGTRSTQLQSLTSRTHIDEVAGVHPTFSPDSKRLATLDRSVVRIHKLATGRDSPSTDLGNGAEPVTDMLFSPVNATLAVGCGDGRVRVIDTDNGQVTLTSPLPIRGGIEAIAYSPDGTAIAIADGYPTVRLWNLAARSPRASPITQSPS
jgi:WD40 repeat protein